VLVVDAGEPAQRPATGCTTAGAGGRPPAELLSAGRDELRGYGGTVRQGTAVAARRDGEGFAVELGDGSTVRARRLLVATGLVDELPDVPGVAELWGTDVLHCPYCHGWEARDAAIGVLATSPLVMHGALLWRQLSDDVTVFLHTADALTDDDLERLAARDIAVVTGAVSALEIADGRLTGVRLADGTVVPRRFVVVAPASPPGRPSWPTWVSSRGAAHGRHRPRHGRPAGADGATAVPGVTSRATSPTCAARSSPPPPRGSWRERASTPSSSSRTPPSRCSAAPSGGRREHRGRAVLGAALRRRRAGVERARQRDARRRGAGPAAGTALDLGCGEGGDAVWLALRGWR
jgi:hypothetical protein